MPLDADKIAQLDAIYGGGQPSLSPEKIAQLDAIYGVEKTPMAGDDKGALTAGVQGFNSVVPFGNRITAGGAALASYPLAKFNNPEITLSDLYDTGRANQRATEEANAMSNLAGAGLGIAATLPIGLSKAIATTPVLGNAANALSRVSTATGNFIRGSQAAEGAGLLARGGSLALRSAKAGAVAAPIGALYGAGDAPEGQQLEGAATGAGMAGGISAALPILGAGAGATLAAVGDKLVRRSAVKSGEIVRESLSKPLQKVYDRLRADFPDDAEFKKALYSYGSSQDKALIEAGGARTANLAEGAAQYPTGGAKATEFFTDATGKAPENLKTTLSKTVSPSTNYSSDVDAILETGRAKAAPLYSDAFKLNQSVKSPVIDKILQTPEGKSALGEAVKNMQNEMARVAVPDKELTAMVKELSDIGMMDAQRGGVAKGLKLRTLDYVKKSMDDTIKTAIRAGDDGAVRRITSLKNTLIDEIDAADKSGLYAKARGEAGDYLSLKKAMEDGLEFFKDDAENIPRRMSNMGTAEKKAYRAGVVKILRNDIDNKYDGQNVARLFDKPATRQKLMALLPPKDFSKLLDDAKSADNIFKLRNQITGNSRTSLRQVARQEFDESGQAVIENIARNGMISTARNVVVNVVKKTFDGMSDKSAGEVADILYQTDPKIKHQIIKQLVNEANSSGAGLRSTEAAKKLGAFYRFTDAIALKNPTAQDKVGEAMKLPPAEAKKLLQKAK